MKHWMRIASCVLACALGGALLAGCTDEQEEEELDLSNFPFYTEEYETMTYNGDEYERQMSQPYWLGNIIYNEIALPIAYENGEAYATLLYTPLKVISVMDQTLETTYQEGKDYTVDAENGRLLIPEGSAIALLSEKTETGVDVPEGYELAAAPDSVNKYVVWDLGVGPFVYTESSLFYGRYLSVTYAYDVRELPKDVFAQYDSTLLGGLRSKLEQGQDIRVAVIGDSISAGCSSTGDNLNVKPYTPCYANQVVSALEQLYGVEVTLTNAAVGGTVSEYPLTPEGSTKLQSAKEAKPDLCIIAYGMNDATASPAVSPVTYKNNIEDILLQIKAASPDCCFILVNSFPCNPLYEREIGMFDKYLGQLQAIAEEFDDGSVAVVDMQAVGKNFMEDEGKRYCEISSSNVNHPNDFMHRVYAMNLLTVICDYKSLAQG